MQIRRIGPDGAFVREFTDMRRRVGSLETRPAGEQFISQSLTTRDPVTGEETVFGQLPDGSFGIQPFIGDIEPPPVATAPFASPQPGTITLVWDGAFVADEAQPRDFDHLNVVGHKIVNNATVSSVVVGVIRLNTEAAFVTTDVIPVDDVWEFSFESVDYNGNISARSARSNRVTMFSVMSDPHINETIEEILADAKTGRTFTGGVQPAVEFRNDSNIWIDTSLGDNLAVTRRWDATANGGVGGWVPVKDGAITQAQIDAATDAQEKADAAYSAAINAQGFTKNPSFDTWTGSVPTNYSLFGTSSSIVKETSIFKRGPFATRFSTPDAATQVGLNLGGGVTTDLTNLEYYTVELEFYLVSGGLAGAGVRIDWTGLTNNAATIYLLSEVPAPVTGKWYRISKVVRRNPAATGTWTSTRGYLMGNYNGFSGFSGAGAAKELIFDWFNIRPSSAEEILSYSAPTAGQLTALNTSVSAIQLAANGKNRVVYDTAPATGTTAPDGVPYINGDTWYRKATAAPNSIIAQFEYQNGWQARKLTGANFTELDAGTMTVGKLSGQNISGTAIDGFTITGPTIQTNLEATVGIKLTTAELMGYDGNSQKSFSLTTGGTLAIRGEIKSGSTISGANLAASGIYTNIANDRGVKIQDTGIRAWDSFGTPTFVLNASTGEVEVPGLKAGSIKGVMVEANSITSDKLVVSDLTNFWENPDFEDDVVGVLPRGIEIPNTRCRVISGGANSSTKALELDAQSGSVSNAISTKMFPVKPGDQYFFTFDYKFKNAAGSATASLGFRRYSASKSLQSYTAAGATVGRPIVWTSSTSFVYTIPASTYFVRPQLQFGDNAEATNAFHVDNVVIRRMNGGELIVDGALNGRTITGAMIQTMDSPATGPLARGIKLDVNSLRAYNPAGSATFVLDGVTGDVTAIGGFQAGSNTSGVLMDDAAFSNKPGIRFYTGTSEGASGYLPAIYAADSGSTTYAPGELVIMGSEQVPNSSGRTELKLSPKGTGFRLGTIFGPNDNKGISMDTPGNVTVRAKEFLVVSDTIRLQGKTPAGFYGTDTFVWGAGAQTQGTGGLYDIPYATPVPTGTRKVFVTIDAVQSNGVYGVTQSCTGSRFKYSFTSPASNNLSINYQAVWVP